MLCDILERIYRRPLFAQGKRMKKRKRNKSEAINDESETIRQQKQIHFKWNWVIFANRNEELSKKIPGQIAIVEKPKKK